MWIRTQSNRLINLERAECIELVSKRESSTTGVVVYELQARLEAGPAGLYSLARMTQEEIGLRLLEEIVNGISGQKPLFDLAAYDRQLAG
jgi:hypothetical protein